MFNKVKNLILTLTMIVLGYSLFEGYSSYAEDLDLEENVVTTFASKRNNEAKDDFDLKEDVNVTFASKRSSSLKPSITRDQFMKKLQNISNSYVASELNFFTYDPYQGKFIPIYDKNKVSAKQKFSIQVKSFSGDLYFYAFKVSGNTVRKLFPSNKNYLSSNPLQEYVGYDLPSSSKWYNFGRSNQRGKKEFYFFVSQNPIKELNRNIRNQMDLDNILMMYNKERTYTKRILDENVVKKRNVQGKLYPTMLGFKEVYAKKLSVYSN